MAGVGQPAVERLRAFLRELNPGSRALLIAELERNILRGEDINGSELILTELRRSFRDNDPKAQRVGEAARLFFQPLEPFLISESAERLAPGRIARATLEPIWTWICNQVVPAEAAIFSEQVGQALAAHDEARVGELTRTFQDHAVRQMQGMIAAVANDEKSARRLGAQTGTPRGLEDVRPVVGVLDLRDALAALAGKLPGHIKMLSGPQLESVKALLDAHVGVKNGLFRYSLVMLMDRLAAPWQLIRLATRAAGSDTAARIAETPYSQTVNIVLAEIERMVRELEADLKTGRGIAVTALLKDVHDAVRGLRTELDIASDSAWGRQLASIRATISRVLSAEVETMPGRVRRLMRPRPAKEIAPGMTLDADEVTEAESLIGFVMACRTYASELAVNEVTQRTFNDLQQNLDTGTRTLLDALRATGEKERPFRQSQVDAAVRFCAKVFGQEYAALLTKAAAVSGGGSEPKAARA